MTCRTTCIPGSCSSLTCIPASMGYLTSCPGSSGSMSSTSTGLEYGGSTARSVPGSSCLPAS